MEALFSACENVYLTLLDTLSIKSHCRQNIDSLFKKIAFASDSATTNI